MSQGITVEKKKSDKKVIALAIICIILAASLVGVIAVYLTNANNSDLQAQITEKDNTISLQQQQIAALQSQMGDATAYYASQIKYLNQTLSGLNDTLTSANADLLDLQSITQLGKSGILYQQTLTQDPNATTTLWNAQLNYAGYIVVQATATANTTYAETLFSYGEANFDYNQTVGTAGTAIFPVLPGTVEVRIGNVMQTSTNNATVTVTYYY